MYTYLCIHMYICMQKVKQRDRESERQRARERESAREREREREDLAVKITEKMRGLLFTFSQRVQGLGSRVHGLWFMVQG